MSQNTDAFSGYKWTYYSSSQPGPQKSRAEHFLASTNWDALLEYATEKRNGIKCTLLPDIGLGYNHLVRVLNFTDGTKWVARLRMPSLTGSFSSEADSVMEVEVAMMALVRQNSDIPVPGVHTFVRRANCDVGASFMLMDCLEGNVGMDLGMQVPPEHKEALFDKLAGIHVELSKVRLPKIGTIVSINDDDTFDQGPIPGLGGPFDTATDYFVAKMSKLKFGMAEERVRELGAPYADEILQSVVTFKEEIQKLASKLSVDNNGPFPLCHGDFGHNNIIVDDNYKVLGVIDWEFAFAGPWEVFGNFPLTLSTVPPTMDAPFLYDEDGVAKDPGLRQKFDDQKKYVSLVVQKEKDRNLSNRLSEALQSEKRRDLVTGMGMFENGKLAFYANLIERFLDP